MQDEYRNLDQFFAESLKGYREKPPDDAWQRLEEDLLAARRHRRVVLYRWTAAAAVLLIALTAGYYFAFITPGHQPNDQTLSQVQTPATGQPTQPVAPKMDITDNIPEEPTQTAVPPSSEGFTDMISRTDIHQGVSSGALKVSEQKGATPQLTDEIPTGTPVKDEIQKEETPALAAGNESAEPAPVEKQVPDLLKPEQKNILTGPLTEFTFEDRPEEKTPTSRWSIGGSFAPVYAYRNIQINAEELPPDVNPDMSYYNDSEEPMYSYSGGVDLTVQMKNKWAFQTGLYLSNLGHVNEDVIAYEVEGEKDLMKTSSSTGMIRIITSSLPEEFVDNSVRRDSLTNAVYISSNIRQSFTYLELPLLVRYSFLDKRFGLNLTGGFSPGIMTDYKAQFTYEGERIDLKNENDFYNMILNTQVGVGIHYRITGSLSISLDPAFKYSLNSIRKDHSIQYHPYSISVFTGVRYSF